MTHKYAILGVRRVAGVMASAALAVTAVGMGARTGVARTSAQIAPMECLINGNPLVIPPVEVTPAFWMIAINFDGALSSTAKACVVKRGLGSEMAYQVIDACQVVSTTPNKKVGNGTAAFDTRTKLNCTVTLPGVTVQPAWLWTHAKVMMTNSTSPKQATLLSSTSMGVRADVAPGCSTTMHSRYGPFNYSHSVGPLCGTYKHLVSRVNIDGSMMRGWHTRPDGPNGPLLYGPTQSTGNITIPETFTFTIGATGDEFQLDWIVIDPPGGCCGGV